MAVTLPPSGYMSDNSRTKGEMKTSFEELRDAIEVVDTNTDDNTSDITLLSADVSDVQNDLAVHVNDSDIHVTSEEKDKLIYTPIVISTQSQFDNVFDGTTLTNTSIYISDNSSPYQLNNDVPLGSKLKIDGDPNTIIERAGLYKFTSTGTVGTPLTGIHLTKSLTFDGVKATYTITTNGGFADITYINDSIFEINVIDSETSANGGAYYSTAATTADNIIKNINSCEALNGGAIYGCYNSEISNVSVCTGDAIENCNNSNIFNIHDNIDIAVLNCDNSRIYSVYNHTENAIENCDNCTIDNIHDNLRGAENCDNCTITNVYNNLGQGCLLCNYCTIDNIYNNGSGGGSAVQECNFCTINNVHDNSFEGCNQCDESTISNIQNNNGTNVGAGGCEFCDNCVFIGTFRGNTTSGTYSQISNCNTSMAFIIGDGTTSVKISAVRETINF